MAKLAEPMVHGCGQSFTWTQAYVRHAKKCDGTKPATSGRIVNPGTGSNQHKKKDDHLPPTYPFAKGGSSSSTSSEAKKAEPRRADPPRARSAKRARTSMPREKKKPRVARGRQKKARGAGRVHRRRQEVAPASTAGYNGAISPAAFIAALEAERKKIDDAIAAVQALA